MCQIDLLGKLPKEKKNVIPFSKVKVFKVKPLKQRRFNSFKTFFTWFTIYGLLTALKAIVNSILKLIK
jgi:hypothetical protein